MPAADARRPEADAAEDAHVQRIVAERDADGGDSDDVKHGRSMTQADSERLRAFLRTDFTPRKVRTPRGHRRDEDLLCDGVSETPDA